MKNLSLFSKLVLVTSGSLLLLGAGCASPSEKITEKAIEEASGGKVDVDINGTKGATTIVGKDGSTVAISGDGGARPISVPEDLPNVSGAKNFSWFSAADSGIFSYEIPNNDYQKSCAEQLGLLTKAGWTKSNSYEMAVDNVTIQTLTKPGFTLNLTCSSTAAENSADKKTNISLTKTKTK